MNNETIEALGWIVLILCIAGLAALGMLLDAGVIK